ncbi:hypothetical protein SaccyDRAFT_3433 [Saccharomonospora cyanea NA-134]|uniref:Uncharacterized protein n=1 Tax=Saccharomonospora cyanea NA-134 TaxID=882082 RepID=H5XR23_9PSEU|nr:hypothetical protein SaccyDRAFT_3433 [Saccharomonospora cyanea NA-134]
MDDTPHPADGRWTLRFTRRLPVPGEGVARPHGPRAPEPVVPLPVAELEPRAGGAVRFPECGSGQATADDGDGRLLAFTARSVTATGPYTAAG